MERTDYVKRAKRLLLDTARTSALVIVPLAAACTARANITSLPTTNFACSANGNSCSGAGVGPISSNPDGMTGASFYTAPSLFLGYTSGGTMNFFLTMSAYGIFSGSLASSIPVDWDFNIIAPGVAVSDWSLLFQLSSSAVGNGNLGSVTETGSGSGIFQGADTMSLAIGDYDFYNDLYETVMLTVYTTGGQGSVNVDVYSATSFDFNGAAVNGAPEPASVGLCGAALAFLGGLLRRRKSPQS